MSKLITVLRSKAQLAALKLAVNVLPSPRPIVLLGADSALQLCRTISHVGAKRVLVVTDAILQGLGVVSPLETKLQEYGIDVVVFSGVTPDPTVRVVEAGLAVLRSGHCDAVLAVGGDLLLMLLKLSPWRLLTRKSPVNWWVF